MPDTVHPTRHDFCISVTANGRSAFYACDMGSGNLIWDIRFGLFGRGAPDPERCLDFVADTSWASAITRLDGPLENPVFGTTAINFDARRIVNNTWSVEAGYTTSDRMSPVRLYGVLRAVTEGWHDDRVPALSMLSHLRYRRLRLVPDFRRQGRCLPDIVLPSDVRAAVAAMDQVQKGSLGWVDYMAQLDLPAGWDVVRRKGPPPSDMLGVGETRILEQTLARLLQEGELRRIFPDHLGAAVQVPEGRRLGQTWEPLYALSVRLQEVRAHTDLRPMDAMRLALFCDELAAFTRNGTSPDVMAGKADVGAAVTKSRVVRNSGGPVANYIETLIRDLERMGFLPAERTASESKDE
jgi:hypothetical protein